MANRLPNEDEIYEKIHDENITVHPVIWDLISHHIGNDLYIINLMLGSAVVESTQDPKPISVENARKIYQKVFAIKEFLDKLSKATKKDRGF